MAARPLLIIMVKEPRAGRVKTRLGREIGMVAAAWWMRHQVARLLRRLRDPRWEIVLAVAPDRAVGSGVWPRDLARVAQGLGDLGDRMGRLLGRNTVKAPPERRDEGRAGPRGGAIAPPRGGGSARPGGSRRAGRTLYVGPSPVCLIGSDIPGINRGHIARAFARLGGHDAVIGPAPDGGYWLIGLGPGVMPPAGFLRDVRWSTAEARADTLRSMTGLRVAMTDTLADVDTAADLQR
ncbi:TIGR04282 family arsenosugar biosynthesis glycosyltransferase [Pseudooceanicola sp. C21-150M6]|uniref:TIGR04282 family arsenosugar biosynthesis glycosyltransferase n=1 Tax=Pseudooceanicola sp. C21-150M6 TaxID=3434355 RepID=UPI003D7F73C1